MYYSTVQNSFCRNCVILSCFSGLRLTETLPDPDKKYVSEGPVQVGIQYSYDELYMCIQGSAAVNANSGTLEPVGPRHYLPAACVIAQQYSSSNFAAAREPANNNGCGPMPEKFGRP